VKLPADWRASIDAQISHNLTHYRGLAGVDNDRWQQLVDQKLYNPLRDTQRFGPATAFYDRALKYYGAHDRFVTLGDYTTLDAIRPSKSKPHSPHRPHHDQRRQRLRMEPTSRATPAAAPTATARWPRRLRPPPPAPCNGSVSLVKCRRRSSPPAGSLPSSATSKPKSPHATSLPPVRRNATSPPPAALKVDLAGGFCPPAPPSPLQIAFPRLFSPAPRPSPSLPAGGSGEVTYVSVNDPLRGNELNETVISSELLNTALRPEYRRHPHPGPRLSTRPDPALPRFPSMSPTPANPANSSSSTKVASSASQSLFPGRVTRAPRASGDPCPVGRVQSILTGTFNLAYRQSQNWTTAVDYAWTECLGGRLDLYGRWLMFQRYDLQILPGGPTVDELSAPTASPPASSATA